MAVQHGKNTRVLLNEHDMSAYFNSGDVTWEVNADEVTCFGGATSAYVERAFITGLRGGSLSFTGFYDTTTSEAVDAVLPGDLANATAIHVTYAPYGLTNGYITYSVQSIYTSYNITSPVDGPAAVSLDAQNHQAMSRGISLHNLTAVTSSGNGSAVDQSNSSVNGGVGFLHVTDCTLASTESFQAHIQDSPSCSAGVWADLINFTALTCTGRTSQRSTLSSGVDRYVRGEWDALSTASGTATFAITWSRATSA